MTTTPELHELAKDPQAFDTIVAALSDKMGDRMRAVAQQTEKLHNLAGDSKRYRNTRVPVWGMSDLEAERAVQRRAAHGDLAAATILAQRASEQAILDAVNFELANMSQVYLRAGNRWTRFFPSVTKSNPHIHRSLACRTLHYDTQMSWAPQLSGRTDEEAVAELDEALCSVCFPDAPVALHNYVSKRSQAEQAERAAEKDARATAKAAKQLAPAEQFKTKGRYGERVETVAKCKELVRRAVELEVEVDYWTQVAAGTRSAPGWTPELLTNRRRNLADSLEEAKADADQAERVLIARETMQPGHGMNATEIAKMRANKRKSARKEWGL